MSKRIIYPLIDGTIAVIIPCDKNKTEFEIAIKDVPSGLPFLIIETNILPTSREFRNAWEADFTNPDGIGTCV